MQTAPLLTGLAPTPEAIHWPAAKGVPGNRLPGKEAILEVCGDRAGTVDAGVAAGIGVGSRTGVRDRGGVGSGGSRPGGVRSLECSAAGIASATAMWAAVLHSVPSRWLQRRFGRFQRQTLPARAAAVVASSMGGARAEAEVLVAVAAAVEAVAVVGRWQEVTNHE